MSNLKSFKVVWWDPSGILRQRVYSLDLAHADRARVKDAGIEMAENSRFGFKSLVWVVPCWYDGTCRVSDLARE
jgi:hypothetical protein